MNRGKVGRMMLIALIAVGYATMFILLNEIPKLEKRVDELKLETKARDEALKVQKKRHNDLEIKLVHEQEQVAALTLANKAKDNEIARLRAPKPSAEIASRGQDYREVSSLGEDFEVTWYNDTGYTKSGKFVTKGITVAVDPRYIPLGSWLKLAFPDGREYIRQAQDTGGAVKGHIIDIYDNASDHELRQRGRTHQVKVTLLRKE